MEEETQGAQDRAQALADALNNINRANLHGVAGEAQWRNLVDEYFLYEADEEEAVPMEQPPEPPSDDSEEEEEPSEEAADPLVVTDPMDEIMREEWSRCEKFR